VFLAVLVLVTRYGLKLIRLFFDGVAAGTVVFRSFDPDWAVPTYRLVRILVVAFAVVVAYPYVPGSQTDAFKGVSIFIGIVFSLGSSSLIGNIIAGYSMTYRRAFRVGDRVRVGEHVGDVDKIRLMVTHLRTPKNEEIVIPNSQILSSEVVNYSTLARQHGLILHTTVGIGYEAPWRQVEAMLLEAADRTEGLLKEPRPFVLQKALGDFSVTYEVNAYCDTPHLMLAHYAALHRNILDVFNEYGVQIMTPAYEGDPAQPKVVSRSDWYLAPAKPPESGGGKS
jgi:small-conductance mechanosensitive channel